MSYCLLFVRRVTERVNSALFIEVSRMCEQFSKHVFLPFSEL